MTNFVLTVQGMKPLTGEIAFPPPIPPPAPIRQITVPDDGFRYVQLVDDWDTEEWGYMPRSKAKNYKIDPPWNGLPATVQTSKLFHKLRREWQLRYLELIRRSNAESVPLEVVLSDYENLTRDSGGWRDQHTWNNWRNERDNIPPDEQKVYTDWVLNKNIPPAWTYGDAMQQDLLSSGNIIRVIREDAAASGYVYYETLNTKLPPPDPDKAFGDWALVGWCTVSAYNFDTGEKHRFKWSRFGGYGCPLMHLGRDGINRVEKFWTRPVEPGQVLDLYI